jgi:hypothetical protein
MKTPEEKIAVSLDSPPDRAGKSTVADASWRVRQLEHELAAVKSSWSWRLTKPLRFLRDGIEHRVRPSWQRAVLAKQRRAALKEGPGSFLPSCPVGLRPDYAKLFYPSCADALGRRSRLTSMLCEKAFLDSPAAHYWTKAMGLNWILHRKLWEFCFVVQALFERDMLREGRRGLGFAVGEEPLPALFASMGCEVLATDLDAQDDRATAWAETAQLATSVDKLSRPLICPDDIFRRRVAFRAVDMNNIPKALRNFDFTWSSCSFEHCGSIDLGIRFICNQMDCLKPGGVAIHTTEFNLTSNEETISAGGTVIFRLKDVEEMVTRLRNAGHTVEPLCLAIGDSQGDKHVDVFPYADPTHLKLLLADRFISTSIALIIRKSERPGA